MKIINVQANDYGEYICEGRNKLGIGRAFVTLYGECGIKCVRGRWLSLGNFGRWQP